MNEQTYKQHMQHLDKVNEKLYRILAEIKNQAKGK
jgi:hypothetical protein